MPRKSSQEHNAIPYLDPNAQTQAFGITYKAQNINKRIFRMTIFDRSSNTTIRGDASGKLTASVGSLTKVDMSHRIGMIFWSGSFKLYKTYSYTSVIKGYAPVRVILRSHVIRWIPSSSNGINICEFSTRFESVHIG